MPLPRVLLITDGTGEDSSPALPAKVPYHVHTVTNLGDGLAAFRALRPDVVVLDVNQPDGSGMEALRALRTHDALCPVILVAGRFGPETALEAIKEGAFDYLVKPVEPARLLEQVGRAVETAWGLQSVVKEAMLRTRGGWPASEQRPTAPPAPIPAGAAPRSSVIDLKVLIEDLQRDGGGNLYARLLCEVDRIVLTEVLRQTMGNQLRASAIMGIDRKTLRQKLRNLGLAPSKAPPGPETVSHPALVPIACEEDAGAWREACRNGENAVSRRTR